MAELKFEEALKKLEAIVDDLEGGELNLDEAIKKYEEGMKLSGLCYKKLQEIQKKVEILVKDSSGKFATKDFDAGAANAADSSEPTGEKPAQKKKRPKGEELLF
jgi:exodeoxyribonuclease VII small subunit